MISIINDSILNAKENIISHQTNCSGVYNRGIAKQVREKFPKAYDEYRKFYLNNKHELLGKCQIINCGNVIIAHLFGQERYGIDTTYTDYNALSNSIFELFLYSKIRGLSLAMPYGIGCGLAGGDWETVYEIIKRNSDFFKLDITLYKYKG